MESENRNKQGRFVSGHKGAKPKGAINKTSRDYIARLHKINNLLEVNLEENINSLKGKAYVMFWLEVQKMIHVKLAKFSEPDPAKEPIRKIIFEVVGSDGKPYVDPDDSPASPVAGVSGPPQPDPVPPAANAPILYGAVDMGRVRTANRFKRTSSF